MVITAICLSSGDKSFLNLIKIYAKLVKVLLMEDRTTLIWLISRRIYSIGLLKVRFPF